MEFNNTTTSRFAQNNDQTLVLGDQFLTVRKNQAIYVANYQESIIMGRVLNLRYGDRCKTGGQSKRVTKLTRALIASS